jgi:hypothetical protein
VKTLTECDHGPEKAAAISKDVTDLLMASMRAILRDHDISMPSTHLLMVSKLVGFLPLMDADTTAQFLISLIDIVDAGDDAFKMAAAQADYNRSHEKLLRAFDLFYAQPGDGGRA